MVRSSASQAAVFHGKEAAGETFMLFSGRLFRAKWTVAPGSCGSKSLLRNRSDEPAWRRRYFRRQEPLAGVREDLLGESLDTLPGEIAWRINVLSFQVP